VQFVNGLVLNFHPKLSMITSVSTTDGAHSASETAPLLSTWVMIDTSSSRQRETGYSVCDGVTLQRTCEFPVLLISVSELRNRTVCLDKNRTIDTRRSRRRLADEEKKKLMKVTHTLVTPI